MRKAGQAHAHRQMQTKQTDTNRTDRRKHNRQSAIRTNRGRQ
jgi:hypothetical protein